MKILLVDDNNDILRFVNQILQLEGHTVSIARNGLEALQNAAADRPDAVVLDVNMPGMEGWEVCRRLKQQFNIPVMLLTVRAEKDDLKLGAEVGADVYLPKPFEITVFLSSLNAMLRKSYGSRVAGGQ
jgi:DNA-binding response OmpR family regulator